MEQTDSEIQLQRIPEFCHRQDINNNLIPLLALFLVLVVRL